VKRYLVIGMCVVGAALTGSSAYWLLSRETVAAAGLLVGIALSFIGLVDHVTED
jgi:hypothetical protein